MLLAHWDWWWSPGLLITYNYLLCCVVWIFWEGLTKPYAYSCGLNMFQVPRMIAWMRRHDCILWFANLFMISTFWYSDFGMTILILLRFLILVFMILNGSVELKMKILLKILGNYRFWVEDHPKGRRHIRYEDLGFGLKGLRA